MSYKTIAVQVNESVHSADRIRLAAAIAAQHDARLVGVATTALPSAYYMPGIDGGSSAVLMPYLNYMKERALSDLDAFKNIAKEAGIAYEARLIEEEAAMALCLQARYSDLIVIGQHNPDETMMTQRSDIPEYVVINSPRPVLIIPYAGRFDTIGKRVVVAWDASVAASRAIASAMPLLKLADSVQVVVFDARKTPDAHGEQPGADVALYLARHGVKVEVSQQGTDGGVDIGNALLSHLADAQADLLVMGGYGHSRFREILLGGVTRTMLAAMTVPVLMEH